MGFTALSKFFVFFFKQKTAYELRISDWSSDVCSSDLHPLAIKDYRFLTGVGRIKMGKLTAFVASPLRALMDLVAMRKERWTGIDWLTRGLRIEEDLLLSLKHSDFAKLRPVYKHKTANAFPDALECAGEKIGRASCRERVGQAA